MEGAEITDGIMVQTYGSMPGIQGLLRRSGSNAFCLQADDDNTSVLFFEKWLYATERSKLLGGNIYRILITRTPLGQLFF